MTPRLVFAPILPELILTGAAIVTMLYEAFVRRSERWVHLTLAVLGLVAAAYATGPLWHWTGDPLVLGDTVAVDRFSVVARFVLLGAALVGCLYYTAESGRHPEGYRGEFYPLVLFATAGMTLITAANDLIVVFLALETLSLALYVLTGITGGRRANEAAMKYFLLGSFSSAFFLYGVAMAYGAADSTKIVVSTAPAASLVGALSGQTGNQAIALLAVAFLAIGFAFKISAAPFHMWTPDVYQGAPTPVTAYMSSATKVAAFFALMRVFDVAFQPLTWTWTPLVYGLALISMVVGAFLGVAQTDVKRMLAYSSIAQAGFILTGLTAPNAIGIRSAMFYLIAYSVVTLGSFGIVMLVGGQGDEERTSLSDYAGLARRRPALAGLMTVFLLSLAGIPPTVGFIAKVNVFGAAIAAGNWPLVVVAVLMSVVAAFFYLRVIVFMYMRAPETGTDELEVPPAMPQAVTAVLAVAAVALGVFPGVLSGVLQQASVLKW
ncbi:MAG: NADH-quinone oxidoreductase subunit N [Actinomycetota bacterium]